MGCSGALVIVEGDGFVRVITCLSLCVGYCWVDGPWFFVCNPTGVW